MNPDMTKPSIQKWLSEPLSADVKQALERLRETEGVMQVAVMPDVHLSTDFCIGTVVATEHFLFPDAVGGDIGCGMIAVRFGGSSDFVMNESKAAKLLRALGVAIPTNRHKAGVFSRKLPESLQNEPLSSHQLERMKTREGCVQLGTLGRGNHFVEFQRDRENALWLMIHSGSRAMGQAIRGHHLKHAERSKTGVSFLDVRTEKGQFYLRDMNWALDYAMANREKMLEAATVVIQRLFGLSPDKESLVHCHHNHVLLEKHDSNSWWVHRKGANAAHEGRLGIIPGSMGSNSYIVEGRGCKKALCSSSHGAGRMLRRKEAHKQFNVKELHRQMRGVWFDHGKSRQLLDEAPGAYKNIRNVMRAQRELVRIVHVLFPVLSYKGC